MHVQEQFLDVLLLYLLDWMVANKTVFEGPSLEGKDVSLVSSQNFESYCLFVSLCHRFIVDCTTCRS